MKRFARLIVVLIACVVAAAAALPAAAAGPGDLDPSFSGDGVRTVDYAGAFDTFYGAAVHGSSPAACGTSDNQATITAFKPSGGLDTDFSGDGLWRQDILGNAYSYLEACRYLPDGRIVAAGAARTNSGDDRMIVVVRKPNGKPDTGFSHDGLTAFAFPHISNVYAYDLKVLPDGKFLVVGETYDSSTSPTKGWFAVARVRQNGSLDQSFSGDGRATVNFHKGDEGVWKVAVQSDGTIVLAGWVRNKADTEWNTGVAKLKPNGAPDTSFSGDGKKEYNFLKGSDDYALGLGLRSDGRILVGMYAYEGGYRARIARLKPNGKPDTSFGGGDGLLTGFEPDFDLQDLALVGGKIVVAGRSGSDDLKLIRLRRGGTPDSTFGTGGAADLSGITGALFDIAIDAQGRIVGGGRTGSDGQVLRVLG
jgi:uncharacterized delta-60 repeat protein